jgi:ABC-2 type transport system permease protein
MTKVLAIIRRELIAYFSSPLAYLVLTAFLFMQGIIFYLIVAYSNRPGTSGIAPLSFFFGQDNFFFWLYMLFVVPVLTMRLVAEELRSGTIEVLLTSPLTEGQVIIGKFLGAWIFYLVLWAPTVVYVLLLRQSSTIDMGPVLTGYLGVMLVGFMFLAIGTFASTLSRNQLIAAILGFAILLVVFMIPFFEGLMTGSVIKSVLAHMNLWNQIDSFSRGIVDTRHVVYLVSVGGLFLFFATKWLEATKGR